MYPDILTGEFTNATAGGHRNNTGLKRIRNFCDYFRWKHFFLDYYFTFLVSLVKVKTYCFLNSIIILNNVLEGLAGIWINLAFFQIKRAGEQNGVEEIYTFTRNNTFTG